MTALSVPNLRTRTCRTGAPRSAWQRPPCSGCVWFAFTYW